MGTKDAQLEISFGAKPTKSRRRKPARPRKGASHAKRPPVSARTPQHVTLRVVPEVRQLRRRKQYQAIRRALHCSVGWSRWQGRFRVCQISIQGDHLHLLVEADDRTALSRGMQGFTISCAKQINAALGRQGSVFIGRYHARALTTPLEVRNALRYVLGNWRHHGWSTSLPAVPLDPFSSAATFSGWVNTPPAIPFEPGREYLMVWLPKTWLLETGWKRHGLLDPWETPG